MKQLVVYNRNSKFHLNSYINLTERNANGRTDGRAFYPSVSFHQAPYSFIYHQHYIMLSSERVVTLRPLHNHNYALIQCLLSMKRSHLSPFPRYRYQKRTNKQCYNCTGRLSTDPKSFICISTLLKFSVLLS